MRFSYIFINKIYSKKNIFSANISGNIFPERPIIRLSMCFPNSTCNTTKKELKKEFETHHSTITIKEDNKYHYHKPLMWKSEKTYSPITSSILQWTSDNWTSFFNQDVFAEKDMTSDSLLWHISTTLSHAWIEQRFMTTLQIVLTKFELHTMQLFINDIVWNVKIGNKKGPKIHTNFGICQGNYLSSPLFILYLSHAVKPLPSQIGAIDYGNSLWFILE